MDALETLRDGVMHYVRADAPGSGEDLTREAFEAILGEETLRDFLPETLYLLYWGGGFVPRTIAVIARSESDAYEAAEEMLRDSHPDEVRGYDADDDDDGPEVSMESVTQHTIREYLGEQPATLEAVWARTEGTEREAMTHNVHRLRVVVERGWQIGHSPIRVFVRRYKDDGQAPDVDTGDFETLAEAQAWLVSQYAGLAQPVWIVKY